MVLQLTARTLASRASRTPECQQPRPKAVTRLKLDLRLGKLQSTHDGSARGPWYCSSVTFSIQSTTLPLSSSWMAICVMAVVGDAPCQCFSPGGHETTSPGRMTLIGPPQLCTKPQPDVTMSV